MRELGNKTDERGGDVASAGESERAAADSVLEFGMDGGAVEDGEELRCKGKECTVSGGTGDGVREVSGEAEEDEELDEDVVKVDEGETPTMNGSGKLGHEAMRVCDGMFRLRWCEPGPNANKEGLYASGCGEDETEEE